MTPNTIARIQTWCDRVDTDPMWRNHAGVVEDIDKVLAVVEQVQLLMLDKTFFEPALQCNVGKQLLFSLKELSK